MMASELEFGTPPFQSGAVVQLPLELIQLSIALPLICNPLKVAVAPLRLA
jgi:hypothetical protein